MIAMQYSIALPADYDMAIIRRRIADKGPLLDRLPGLVLKAYLVADRGDPALSVAQNLYAPFYLWRDAAAMHDFLDGAAFGALCAAFGRPAVQCWLVSQAQLRAEVGDAGYACRARAMSPASEHGAVVAAGESEWTACALAAGALAAVSGYEPMGWTRVRFALWRDLPASAPGHAQTYAVRHLSAPEAASGCD